MRKAGINDVELCFGTLHVLLLFLGQVFRPECWQEPARTAKDC